MFSFWYSLPTAKKIPTPPHPIQNFTGGLLPGRGGARKGVPAPRGAQGAQCGLPLAGRRAAALGAWRLGTRLLKSSGILTLLLKGKKKAFRLVPQ